MSVALGSETAIERAIKQIDAHPMAAVKKVERLENSVDVLTMFDTALGNRSKARGESGSGVLASEPVTFTFGPDYPFRAPGVFLRNDFDRSHPHLQPGSDEVSPVPCYVDGDPDEFLRLRGMYGVADQISRWLSKAAEFSLIDPRQGWEPVRRDHLDNLWVLDEAAVRALPSKTSNSAFIETMLIARDEFYHLWSPGVRQIALKTPLSKDVEQRLGYTAIGLVAWSGKRPDGTPFLADKYRPENVSTLKDLVARANGLGCGEGLRSKLTLLRQRYLEAALAQPLTVGICLLAKRPVNLIGSTSDLELCLYEISINDHSALDFDAATKVNLIMHRSDMSPSLMRRASGLAEPIDQQKWGLIGCGSLGSKIALHLTRQASAPDLILDNRVMLPHNFARHALYPFNTQAHIEPGKAKQLGHALAQFGITGQAPSGDASQLCLDGPEKDQKQFWGKLDLLVNTTGSPTLTEALCCSSAASRPRAIETCLYGSGQVGHLMTEGKDKNPSILDLQAESFRLFAEEPKLSDKVFSAEGQAVMIGQGCSAITSPMSDAFLSSSAAVLAVKIGKIVDEGAPTLGSIEVGSIDPDTMNQSWQQHDVEAFVVVSTIAGSEIRISDRVAQAIDEDIADYPGVETGGVLIGRYSELADTFTIVDILPAPSDSTRAPNEFVLGEIGLTDAIDHYSKKAHGALYPVGTWHNHLNDSGESQTDLKTAARLAVSQLIPVAMIIRTPTRFRGFIGTAKADGFSLDVEVANG